MFKLEDKYCKLTGVNPRSEFVGNDTRPACDINFTFKMGNDELSAFDPDLKEAFYKKDDDPQGELIEDGDHLTVLKFPLAGGLKWSEKFEGYTAIVNYGIGGPSDVTLADSKVHKFAFDFQEGGTVHVSLQVQAHPGAEEFGKLCTLIQQEVKITLRPPTSAEEEANIAARKALGDLFSGQEEAEIAAAGEDDAEDPEDPRADFDEDPLAGSDLAGTSEPADPMVDEDEARYTEAIAFVKTLGHVSISKVTRKFKCTEIVASRMLQRMEDDGIVAEAGNNGVRDVVAVTA